MAELKGIYNTESAFNIKGSWVWSGQLRDNSTAGALGGDGGGVELWLYGGRPDGSRLGPAVRSPE